MKDCAKLQLPPQEGNSNAPLSVASLKIDEVSVLTKIKRVMAELTEIDLDRTVFREAGKELSLDSHLPIRDVLSHLMEEELQHGGELNALLWQIDVDGPDSDWIRLYHDQVRIRDPAWGS